MRLAVLALSLGTLCIPGIAVAQSDMGPITSTSGVTCTGSGASGKCTVNGTNQNSRGSGTLRSTTPSSTGDSSVGTGTTGTTGATGSNMILPPASGGSLGGSLGGSAGGSSGGSSGGGGM